MRVTGETVAEEYERTRRRAGEHVSLINRVRGDLADAFDVEVGEVSVDRYREEVDVVYADGDVAVNVAALSALLTDLDVEGDYPGFVVDEVLGRELAATIAGGRPLSLLAEATFHYADATHHPGATDAGRDDLDAALAAGFQTRLPGWEWTDETSPFGIDR